MLVNFIRVRGRCENSNETETFDLNECRDICS